MTTTSAPTSLVSTLADLRAIYTPPLSATEIERLTDPLLPSEKRRLQDVIDVDGLLSDPETARSPRLMRTVVGSLRMLGYSTSWLSEVTGLPWDDLSPVRHAKSVPTAHLRTVLTVAARIGDRPATPESTGLDPQQIADERSQARREHHYPPACYDERYVYVTGVDDEGREWSAARPPRGEASRDAQAAKKIRAAAHFFRHGGTSSSLARDFGFERRTWNRVVRQLHIGLVMTGGGNHVEVLPLPGQDQLRKAVFEAETALDNGADPEQIFDVLLEEAATIEAQRAHFEAVAQEAAAA